MNPDNIKQSIQAVVDGLTPLAQKLQIPIQNVWAWAIKYNYAIAFQDLATIPLFVLILIFTVLCFKKSKWSSYGDPDNGWAWAFIIVAVVCAFSFVGMIIGTTSAIPRFVSPEFSTAGDIVHLIKGN